MLQICLISTLSLRILPFSLFSCKTVTKARKILWFSSLNVCYFTSKVVKMEKCDCLLKSNDYEAQNQHNQWVNSYTKKTQEKKTFFCFQTLL